MNIQRFKLSSNRLKLTATIVFCAVAVAGWGLWMKYKVPEKLPTPQDDYPETRPLLATVAASGSARQSLLANDFTLVNRFRDLSDGCRVGFLSSFTTTKSGKLSSADIADPGELFQESDALVAGLRFRRLVFAGEQSGKCFIYYQHGGKMYPQWCLAVIDESSKKPLWVGMRIGSLPAQTIDELRAQLLKGVFRDDAGLVC
jgi:hypothetical protein